MLTTMKESIEKKTEMNNNSTNIGKLIKKVRGLTVEILSIDKSIKESFDKLKCVIQEERNNSERSSISLKLYNKNAELNELRDKKKLLISELRGIKEEREKLNKEISYPSSYKSYKSCEDIDGRIDELNDTLIKSRVTLAEENKITSEISQLLSIKQKMKSSFDKLKVIKEKDDEIRKIKGQLDSISDNLLKMNEEIRILRGQIDEFDKGKTKSSAIESLEKSIAQYKGQKKEKIMEKNKIREEIKVAEEEKLKLTELAKKEEELEKKKGELKEQIQAKREKIDLLTKERGDAELKELDILSGAISELSINVKRNEKITLTPNCFSKLIRFKLPMPKSEESIKNVLEQIEGKKTELEKLFEKSRLDSDNKTKELNYEIAEIKKSLSELPPTDFELLRKVKSFGSRHFNVQNK